MEESIKKNAKTATTHRNNGTNKNGRGKAKHTGCFLNSIYKFQTSFADGITADNLFDSRTEKIIGCQADRLVCTGLFPQHEREDLQQILRLALLHEMSNFAAGGDRYTFASNVVCNYGKNLIAKRAAEREETNGELVSLDESLPGGDTLGDMLENAREKTPIENVIMKETTDALLSRLNDVDRIICLKILGGASVRDLENSWEVGLRRGGVRHRLERIIRPIAVECGLDRLFVSGGEKA